MNRTFLTTNFCNALRHTFSLKGRASRRELWGFFLLPWLAFLAVHVGLLVFFCLLRLVDLSADSFVSVVLFLYLLFMKLLALLFVPFFTLSIRRLHDVGRSGKWVAAWVVLHVPVTLMALGPLASGEPFMVLAAFVVIPALLSQLLLPTDMMQTGMLVLTICGMLLNFLLSFFLLIHLASRGDTNANEYGPPPAPIP